ncbi:unnamed protein product [Auanema sp. JU1783]|nr:unnamed protein product [Auanema sp. JU1783]
MLRTIFIFSLCLLALVAAAPAAEPKTLQKQREMYEAMSQVLPEEAEEDAGLFRHLRSASNGKPTFIRFGKRGGPSFIRFGRAQPSFIRFGRSDNGRDYE